MSHIAPLPLKPVLQDVFRGFGLYLFFQLGVAPFLFGLIFQLLNKGGVVDFSPTTFHENVVSKGWLTLSMVCGGFCSLAFTSCFLNALQRKCIWNPLSTSAIGEVKFGFVAALLFIPAFILFNGMLNVLVQWFEPAFSSREQAVVEHMRSLMHHPLLFTLTALAIVILVPVTEEFLFRGLLLSYLMQKLSFTMALIISSAIFALFHFSFHGGLGNIPLLSSIFLLSLVLGYIYQKRRSLWAAIGMHGCFNGINMLLLWLS